jgi:catechol O-methyltransferase
VFIDHAQHMFLPDLKLMEQHSLIASGTVLVTDNVIYPGAPDYLGIHNKRCSVNE